MIVRKMPLFTLGGITTWLWSVRAQLHLHLQLGDGGRGRALCGTGMIKGAINVGIGAACNICTGNVIIIIIVCITGSFVLLLLLLDCGLERSVGGLDSVRLGEAVGHEDEAGAVLGAPAPRSLGPGLGVEDGVEVGLEAGGQRVALPLPPLPPCHLPDLLLLGGGPLHIQPGLQDAGLGLALAHFVEWGEKKFCTSPVFSLIQCSNSPRRCYCRDFGAESDILTPHASCHHLSP